jgi:Rrf2 family protein
MVHLASLPPGTRVQRTNLAEFTEVPESFMSKVLQGLVRARLISSKPGHHGGFELAADPQKITLLDVVEAIDGPLAVNLCVGATHACDRHTGCPAHPVWLKAQEAFSGVLRSATVAGLTSSSQVSVGSSAVPSASAPGVASQLRASL